MFKTSITKEEIKEYPISAFEGEITQINDSCNLQEAVEILKKQTVLGFDTESRPSFKKGRNNGVALLQLSTADHAFLFRLNKIGLPMELAEVLADKNIIKVGVAIHDDIKLLQHLQPFEQNSFVELQEYVKQFKIENFGLSKLSAIVLDFRISKRQQLSNWEQEILTPAQQKYAATDAWVGHEIYTKLRASLSEIHTQ